MTFKNRDIYEGNWVSNEINGNGTMWYSNGDKYIG